MKTEFLTKWKNRDIESLIGSMARYTRFVLFGKFLLVFVAVCLSALLFIIPLVKKDKPGERIAFAATEQGSITNPVMTNPKFQGLDKDNNPFTVIAETATHETKDRVALTNIKGDMTTKDNQWFTISADSGTLEIEKRQMQLVGNVNAFYGGGYEIRTDWVQVDMASSEAFGDMPVEAQGQVGTLTAKGFHMFDKGERVVFKGPVKMRIYPKEGKE